jgi:tetratricopeptide (TPR) repeat protein
MLGRNLDALLYFKESLMYLNTSLPPNNPLVGGIGKFEENFITIDAERKEYLEDDTFRSIAIVYRRLRQSEKAISIYMKIKNKYQKNIDSFQQQLEVEEYMDKNKKMSIYNNEIWNLYFGIKNNLAMTYAETEEFDKALEEIRFLNLAGSILRATYIIR